MSVKLFEELVASKIPAFGDRNTLNYYTKKKHSGQSSKKSWSAWVIIIFAIQLKQSKQLGYSKLAREQKNAIF